MAQTSWPFENLDTTETQFSQWAKNINEGVKQGNGDELVVTADGTGMTVSVGSGQSMIRGHYYSSTASESLAITASDPTNPRIDAVVLELDPTANTVLLKVLAGTPAGSPVAPTLTQTEAGVYQLPLAYVAVAATVLAIELVDVTDKRGFMFSGIGKWTTANRPANPVQYQTTGYNTTINAHEFWNGTSWVGFADPITTEGDLIVGGASGVPERLPVGTDDQVLTVVAGVPEWADAGGGGGYSTTELITASGTWTVPAGVTQCDVIIIGGGGGGGGGKSQSYTNTIFGHGGGGGSGSSLDILTAYAITPGDSIAVVIGAGGAGAASVATNSTPPNGSSGSSSSFGEFVSGYGVGGEKGQTATSHTNVIDTVSRESVIGGTIITRQGPAGGNQTGYSNNTTTLATKGIAVSVPNVTGLLGSPGGDATPASGPVTDAGLGGVVSNPGFCGGGASGAGASNNGYNGFDGGIGKSGGGSGGGSLSTNQETTNDGTPGAGGNGATNSGGGGGGSGSACFWYGTTPSAVGGNGGSGVVIIKY